MNVMVLWTPNDLENHPLRMCTIYITETNFLNLPDTEGRLQQGDKSRHKEDGAYEFC